IADACQQEVCFELGRFPPGLLICHERLAGDWSLRIPTPMGTGYCERHERDSLDDVALAGPVCAVDCSTGQDSLAGASGMAYHVGEVGKRSRHERQFLFGTEGTKIRKPEAQQHKITSIIHLSVRL